MNFQICNEVEGLFYPIAGCWFGPQQYEGQLNKIIEAFADKLNSRIGLLQSDRPIYQGMYSPKQMKEIWNPIKRK